MQERQPRLPPTPIIRPFDGRDWEVDLHQRVFRSVGPTSDTIAFEAPRGLAAQVAMGVIVCPWCGYTDAPEITAPAQVPPVRCPRCKGPLGLD